MPDTPATEKTSTPRAPRKPRAPKDTRTPAETQMWNDVLSGNVCRLDLNFPNEIDREIRATEFCNLCRSNQVLPSGIAIFGAVFVGEMNLANCDLTFGLDLKGCTFQNDINLNGGSLRYLYLQGSIVKENIFAQNFIVSQNVFLKNGFVVKGQVYVCNAKIGGSFECDGGHFDYEGEKCFYAQGIDVSQNVFLRNGFVAKGQVSFNGAKIGGNFECDGGKFEYKGEKCLHAQNIEVSHSVYLRRKPITIGPQSVFLPEDFVAKGQVDFNSAKIGGNFECDGGKFEYKGEKCLHAQNIEVSHSVFLRSSFVANGLVDFGGAQIGGQFDCYDGGFLGVGKSIDLWKAKIERDVFFSSHLKSFHVAGTLRLTEVHIHGNLICGKDTNERRFGGIGGVLDGGILLDGAEISGTLYFAPETCGGEIDLSGATIGKIHDEYALTDCVSQNWWTARKRDFGNNFKDRWQALFPPKNPHKTTEGDVRQKQYKLYGLRYKELEPGMCSDWRELVEWIRNADGGAYHPQPYERLAAVLQAHGHENEASEVLIARRRHRLQNLTLPRRAAEILLYDVPILFGYKPWQAVYIAVALICLGGFQFHRAAQQNLLVPTDGDVLTVTVASRNEFVSGELRRTFRAPLRDDWNAKKKRLIAAHPLTERDDSGRRRFVPDGYPEFNAAIYALDAFLPIIDLRQTEYWLPNRSKPGGVWYSKLYWFLDISGWFLTTLLVSSLTGLVRGKDTETIEP